MRKSIKREAQLPFENGPVSLSYVSHSMDGSVTQKRIRNFRHFILIQTLISAISTHWS
jgi:hypothetical protein